MTRLTLGGAIGIVGVLAIGCAAIRAATMQGERLVFTSVLALHSVALLGALIRRGRSPGWLGFAVLGWAYFLAVSTDLFDGPAGNTYLTASDLSEVAFDLREPVPQPPVVDGVVLTEDPDKVTASDRAIQAYKDYNARVSDRDERRRHVGAIADLLGSVVFATAGAGAGRLLRLPGPSPRKRRGRRPRLRSPARMSPRRARGPLPFA